MKEQKIKANELTIGDVTWFSGSWWTVVRIDDDGKIYGVGGRNILGNVITLPTWFRMRGGAYENNTVTIKERKPKTIHLSNPEPEPFDRSDPSTWQEDINF